VPRNNFMGDPLHRFDVRVQRRFTVGGLAIDGIAEVFNLFNHRDLRQLHHRRAHRDLYRR
jgi:hypothetical protein